MSSNRGARGLPRRKIRYTGKAERRPQPYADSQLTTKELGAARPRLDELFSVDNISDGLPQQWQLQRPEADRTHTTASDTSSLPIDSPLVGDYLPSKTTHMPTRTTSIDGQDTVQSQTARPVDPAPLCSAYPMPRPMLSEVLPRQASTNLSTSPETVLEISTPSLSDDEDVTPWTNILRRCWGALQEALDELGKVWDGQEDRSALKEVSSPNSHTVQHFPTSQLTTTSDGENLATPTRNFRPTSSKSRSSHYDTLAPSPVGSRSSKRGRKPRVRHKNATPVRNKQNVDIDHGYSTEDENNDPHVRLRNRILFQDPLVLRQDNFCIFMHKQDSRTGGNDPNAENDNPDSEQGQAQRTPHDAEMLPARQRTPVADAREPSHRAPPRPRQGNMTGDLCRHGVPATQRTCDRLHEADSSSSHYEPAQSLFHQEAPPLQELSDAGATIASNQHLDHTQLEELNGGALESDADQAHHENGDQAADPQGQGKKVRKRTKVWNWVVEKTRPHHDNHTYLSAAPGVGITRRVNPDDNTDGNTQQQLTEESASRIPLARRGPDQWLEGVTPLGEGPNEVNNDGTSAPDWPPSLPSATETDVPLLHGIRVRPPKSCMIMSVSVPPERDTTSLLLLPFDTLQEGSTDSSGAPTAIETEETLMSAYGVGCDAVMADRNALGPICSADESMICSAAMGSMSRLAQIDSYARTENAARSRVKQNAANAANTAWHSSAGSNTSGDWTLSIERADSPASFQDDSNRATVTSEQRATFMYEAHNRYQAYESMDAIGSAIRKTAADRRLQAKLDNV